MKQNTLMVAEAFVGGIATHISELSLGLVKRSHTIHLIYSPVRMDQNARYCLARLESMFPLITLHPIPMAKRLDRSDWQVIKAVRSYMKAEGPFDVLHSHSSKAWLVGQVAALGTGLKSVYTANAFYSHNPDLGFGERLMATRVETMLARRTDAVIAVSDMEHKHAGSLGVKPERLHLVPNGIDMCGTTDPAGQAQRALERTTLRDKWQIRENEICLGYVGRLVPQKAPLGLLRVFHRLLQRTKERVILSIVGSGPQLGACQKLASSLGIADRVLWCGDIADKAVFSMFDVLVLNSIYEGFPYVLLEALRAGLPMIVTDVGGAHMVVESGRNGFVVPLRDEQAMSTALEVVVANSEVRQTMAAESLRKLSLHSAENG